MAHAEGGSWMSASMEPQPLMFPGTNVGVIQGNKLYNISGGASFYSNATPIQTCKPTLNKLEELAGVSKASEFVQIHSEILSIKTKGTGAMFREKREVQRWEGGETKVLWIHGDPGVGKTYIASSFIEWSKELAAKEPPGTAVVIYIYARYDQKLTEYCVILAVLVQLLRACRHLPDVISMVEQFLQECAESKLRPPLNELVRLVKDIVKRFGSVRLIFDGVDELVRDLQYLVVQHFAEIDVQVVFLSRPSALLEDAARELFTQHGRTIAFVKFVAEKHDLDLFITSSIDGVLSLRSVLAKHKKRGYVVRTVKDSAHGMFLHAALQVEKLKRCHTIRAVQQALAEFPAKIEDLYHKTLQRIYDENDSLAQELLVWLLHVHGSLTIDDLRHAVAVFPETYAFDQASLLEEGDMLSMCWGLVVVEAITRQVRFVHYSAYQVLSGLMKIRFGPQFTLASHETISRTCLVRLQDSGFQDATTISNLGHLRKAFASNPFLQYAYHNTSHHLRHASPVSRSLRTMIVTFIDGCERFPYVPCIEDRDRNSKPVNYLAQLHVATLLGSIDLISQMVTDQRIHPDTRAGHVTTRGCTSLMVAAVQGHEDAVKLLLDLGADVGIVDGDGNNALHQPAYMGKESIVKMLCGGGGIQDAINQQNLRGSSPLDWAAGEGHVGVVKWLLSSKGIDVNLIDKDGYSALQKASANGHHQVVLALLEVADLDVNLCNKRGDTPLALASTKGHRKIVEALISHPKVDALRQNHFGSTALSLSASAGHIDIVRVLLNHPGTGLNVANRDGNSPLHLASDHGHHKVVLALLAALPSIDPNSPNEDGNTPLILASYKGHHTIVEALVAHAGIDVNRQSKSGNTALILASSYGYVGIVQLLLDSGSRVNTVNGSGNSALNLASYHGHQRVVHALRATPDVDVFLFNKDHNCALSLAAQKGNTSIVEAFLAHAQARIGQRSKEGNTIFILAASFGHLSLLRYLINFPGLDINLVNDHGDSALNLASHHGHQEAVREILTIPGVDVNSPNKDGNTPIILASYSGYHGIVKLLLAHPKTDVNHQNKIGNTALTLSAFYGHLSVVRLLLSAWDMDILIHKLEMLDDSPNPTLVRGDSPTPRRLVGKLPRIASTSRERRHASAQGSPGLSRRRTYANHSNSSGETAIALAASCGHLKIVQLLLGVPGVDINPIDQNGNSPLIIASNKGYLQVVQALLAIPGVDVNISNVAGESALTFASWRPSMPIVQSLVQHPGTNANHRNNLGNSALLLAAIKGDIQVVLSLLAAPQLDVNLVDQQGNSALNRASFHGHHKVVAALLCAPGIDMNLPNKHGSTPLIHAAWKGFCPVVEALLACTGIDVNYATKSRVTALAAASFDGHVDIVNLLLEAPGLSPNFASTEASSALSLAIKNGHEEVAIALRLASDLPRYRMN